MEETFDELSAAAVTAESDVDDVATVPAWISCRLAGHRVVVYSFPIAVLLGVVGNLLTTAVFCRSSLHRQRRRRRRQLTKEAQVDDATGSPRQNRKSTTTRRSAAGELYVIVASTANAVKIVVQLLPWWLAAVGATSFYVDDVRLCRWIVFVGQTLSFAGAWLLVALSVERTIAIYRRSRSSKSHGGGCTARRFRSPTATAATMAIIFIAAVCANVDVLAAKTGGDVDDEDCLPTNESRIWLTLVVDSAVPAGAVLAAAVGTAVHAVLDVRRRRRRTGDVTSSPSLGEQSDDDGKGECGLDEMTSSVWFVASALFVVSSAATVASHVLFEMDAHQADVTSSSSCVIYTAHVVLLVIAVLLSSANFFVYCLASTHLRRELVIMLTSCALLRGSTVSGRLATSSFDAIINDVGVVTE